MKNLIKKFGTKKIIATAVTVALVATGTIVYAGVSSNENPAEKMNTSNTASLESIEKTEGSSEASSEMSESAKEVSSAVTEALNEEVIKNGGASVKSNGTRNGGSVSSLARQAFDLINNYRTSQGLEAIEWSDSDAQVASVRAQEISTNFSHASASGTKTNHGENIAETYNANAEEVVNLWINSSGHRANMVRTDHTSMGVGVYEVDGKYYWVNSFSKTSSSSGNASNNTSNNTANNTPATEEQVNIGGNSAKKSTDTNGNITYKIETQTDDDGWTDGHLELLGKNEKRSGSCQAAYDYQVVANTGVYSVSSTALYDINEETGEVDYSRGNPLRGLRITWQDINNRRAVKINMKTKELKWA